MIEIYSFSEQDEHTALYAEDDRLMERFVFRGDRQLAMIDRLLEELFSDDGICYVTAGLS